MKVRHGPSTYAQLLALPFMIIAILLLTLALIQFQNQRTLTNIDTEKETIVKYAIQCYASEGSYPPSLEYLEANYGLILNRDRYLYYYEIFASNVLPDIRVIPLTPIKQP